MTGLRKTSDEVGSMDFPAVIELLEYWLEYPPEHILLRGFVGYKSESNRPDSWRAKRAHEMGDTTYTPEPPKTEKESRIAQEFIPRPGGAKHLDCAPPHVQQAIERAKKGEHLTVPQ